MGEWLFACAAKEIQRYILDGDKLKEMVGGSALVDDLCRDFLNQTMKQFSITGTPIVQAAGWARIILDEENAKKLASVWPLLASRYAPGLQMVQAMTPIGNNLSDAILNAEDLLRFERNVVRVPLPLATPLMERCQRTGNAAVKEEGSAADQEYVDAALKRKREIKPGRLETLIARMAGIPEEAFWPDEMDVLADEKYVAVIHADGNSLGSIVQSLSVKTAESFSKFSGAIEQTGLKACAEAFKTAIAPTITDKNNIVPARIIVLGGDDLTVLVRADLAFGFIAAYLAAFERCAKMELDARGLKSLGVPLTACAGIAFVKSGYPFSRAYDLAESLCGYTKKIAKKDTIKLRDGRVPSSFAFHRVTTSITPAYGEILKNELTTPDGGLLAFGPYGIGDTENKLPSFKALQELADSMRKDMPTGTIRSLDADLYQDAATAEQDLKRAIRIANERIDGAGNKFAKALTTLTGGVTMYKNDHVAGCRATPLWDAHLLEVLTRNNEQAPKEVRQ